MIRAVILERSSLFRDTLKKIFRSWFPSIELMEAESAKEVMEKTRTIGLDLLLIDIELMGENMLEVIQRIKNRHPDTTIVALSSFDSVEYQSAAQGHGADYFVSKKASVQEVLGVIRSILTARGEYREHLPDRSRAKK
jgi:DNA-binding NarL/FixJ family response regulator